MTAKKQAITTLDGCPCKKIGINKIRFNVLNFVGGVPKKEKKEMRTKIMIMMIMMIINIYTRLILVMKILKRMTLLEPFV